jgi:hypothetical protein
MARVQGVLGTEMNREIKRLVILRRKNGHVTGRYAHLDIDFDGGGT